MQLTEVESDTCTSSISSVKEVSSCTSMLQVDDEAAGGICGALRRLVPMLLMLRKNRPNRGISVPKSILFY